MNETQKKEIRALRDSRKVAYVASVNAQVDPQIKAMLVAERGSLKNAVLLHQHQFQAGGAVPE